MSDAIGQTPGDESSLNEGCHRPERLRRGLVQAREDTTGATISARPANPYGRIFAQVTPRACAIDSTSAA